MYVMYGFRSTTLNGLFIYPRFVSTKPPPNARVDGLSAHSGVRGRGPRTDQAPLGDQVFRANTVIETPQGLLCWLTGGKARFPFPRIFSSYFSAYFRGFFFSPRFIPPSLRINLLLLLQF